MAAGKQGSNSVDRRGPLERLFAEHPRTLGMSWTAHGLGAIKISAQLIGAGLACLVHAIVPGWFTQTAGKTVARMHEHMIKRKSGAADPSDWPDYEI